MSRRDMLAANWKMHKTPSETEGFLEEFLERGIAHEVFGEAGSGLGIDERSDRDEPADGRFRLRGIRPEFRQVGEDERHLGVGGQSLGHRVQPFLGGLRHLPFVTLAAQGGDDGDIGGSRRRNYLLDGGSAASYGPDVG